MATMFSNVYLKVLKCFASNISVNNFGNKFVLCVNGRSKYLMSDNYVTIRYLSLGIMHESQKKITNPQFFEKVFDDEGNEMKTNKKKIIIPKITLVGTDDCLTVLTLEDAQKLAKRRDLKLVRINDPDNKTFRPVYKLMSGSEFMEADKERRKEKAAKRATEIKGEKLLSLSAKIGEHDLEAKAKTIAKWLQKKYHVRVVISGEGTTPVAAEKVYSVIESHVQDVGRIVQKAVKGADIKCQIILPKKETKADETEASNEKEKIQRKGLNDEKNKGKEKGEGANKAMEEVNM